MEFEFDPAKSAANLAKHGIDFVRASEMWSDPDGIVRTTYGKDEVRWMRVARLSGRHWTAIHTLRASRVRLISVRRSRQEEVEDYEQARRKRGPDQQP